MLLHILKGPTCMKILGKFTRVNTAFNKFRKNQYCQLVGSNKLGILSL